ncbi:MAG: DMT family transporter [Treponema sp.]|nr:DMT family transporter [Treponema sp.]
MENRSLASEMILLLTAALWGFAFVAQRVGMEFMGPLTYNGIRFLMGGASLLPLIYIRRRMDLTRGPAAPDLPGGPRRETPGRSTEAPPTAPGRLRALAGPSLAGGLIITVAANLQQWSMKFITAGKAGFITGLYVVLVPVAGILVKRRTPVLAWAGCAAAAGGLYFLSVTEEFTIARGDLIVLASTFFWTGHILFLDTFAKRVDPVELSAGQFLVCGALTLAGALVFEGPTWSSGRAAAVPLLYGGLVSIGIAYTLQAVAQRRAHPARAAVVMSLETVFAAVGGALLLSERLSPREFLGCALMFAGMLIAQAPSPKRRKRAPA